VPYINSNDFLFPEVHALDHELREVGFRKYSRTQGKLMALQGIIGQASFEGELRPCLPLLRLGQYTLAGKNTSYGFGKYFIEDA
jgi:hypothetical protein